MNPPVVVIVEFVVTAEAVAAVTPFPAAGVPLAVVTSTGAIPSS